MIPSDANVILLTNTNYKLAVCATSLALAADDQSCRIVCPPETARYLKSTKLLFASKISIVERDGRVDLGFAKIISVHSNLGQCGPKKT